MILAARQRWPADLFLKLRLRPAQIHFGFQLG
jgi:hypothetical protein